MLTARLDFRLERGYRFFGADNMLAYSINVWDNGRLCSIVTTNGSHGTHVAGYVPDPGCLPC